MLGWVTNESIPRSLVSLQQQQEEEQAPALLRDAVQVDAAEGGCRCPVSVRQLIAVGDRAGRKLESETQPL